MRRILWLLAFLCAAAALVGAVGAQWASRPAAVVVESVPRLAAVYVNGRYVGQTPARIQGLAHAPHVLRIVHPDRQPHREVVDPDALFGQGAARLWRRLTGEEPVIRVELPLPASSWLAVESVPSGAEVLLNGELRGTTPLRLERLDPGAHEILVMRTGYAPHRETASLEPDSGALVMARLRSRMVEVLLGRLEEDPYNMQDLVDLAHQYLIMGQHQESADTLRRAYQVLADGKMTARPDQDERPELRFLNECYRTFIRFHTYPEENSRIVRQACMELVRKAAESNVGGLGRSARAHLQRMERYAAQNPDP